MSNLLASLIYSPDAMLTTTYQYIRTHTNQLLTEGQATRRGQGEHCLVDMQLTCQGAIDPGNDTTPICGKMYAKVPEKGWSLKSPKLNAGRTIESNALFQPQMRTSDLRRTCMQNFFNAG